MVKYSNYQNKILEQADKEFWNTLVSKDFFGSSFDLYEFPEVVPFSKH